MIANRLTSPTLFGHRICGNNSELMPRRYRRCAAGHECGDDRPWLCRRGCSGTEPAFAAGAAPRIPPRPEKLSLPRLQGHRCLQSQITSCGHGCLLRAHTWHSSAFVLSAHEHGWSRNPHARAHVHGSSRACYHGRAGVPMAVYHASIVIKHVALSNRDNCSRQRACIASSLVHLGIDNKTRGWWI